MACSIKEQEDIRKQAASEYKRLAKMQEQGYTEDLENDVYDIDQTMSNLKAIVNRKPENIQFDEADTESHTVETNLLKAMLQSNGNDGTLALSFNKSNKSISATPSKLVSYKDLYTLTTDKGVYTFAKGEIQSKHVNGKYVTVPAMELTKYTLVKALLVGALKQMESEGKPVKSMLDSISKPDEPIEYVASKTRAEMQKEDAAEAARILSSTNAELQKEIEEAKGTWGHVFVTNREGLLEKKEKNKKLVTKMKQSRLDLFMKIPEIAQIVKNENIKSYYEYINKVIDSILPTKVRYDDLVTFSETTIEQLMGDEPVRAAAGLKLKDRNSVIISSGKVSDIDVDTFTEAWYLKDTEEGRRIARIKDEDLKYDTLVNSKGFKVFKDKNQAEVASRLMNAIKNVNGAHALTHEMIHVGSDAFMKANPEHPATIKVMALYKEALDNKEYIKEVTGEDYWATSIDEFIAEALSNPVLIEQFNNMPTKYGESRLARLFDTLVDTLLGMLGFTKNDSVYQHVMDGFAAMLEAQSEQKNDNTVLGSKTKDADDKIEWDKFKRIEKGLHGNIGKMQELLEELHKIGGEKENVGHLNYLKELIDKMNPKFMKKIGTYIDETAAATGGIIEVSKTGERAKMGIWVSKVGKLAGNQQSEAEVYAHEVIHSYVVFALESARNGNIQAAKLLKELEYTMKVARENMRWQDFLPAKEDSIDAKLEETNAKEMYEYIFDSAHAEDEFMAHVLTNPIVMAKAKEIMLKETSNKNLWQSVKDMFGTLLDLLAGNYSFANRKSNVYDMTMDLTFRLAEYNSNALREVKAKANLIDRATDMFNEFDEGLGEKFQAFTDKHMPKGVIGPRPEGKAAQIKWYADAISRMVVHPVYRKQASKWARSFGMPPEGSIQTIMRDFTEQDKLSKAVDWIALQADRIDGAKMSIFAAVGESVIGGFKKKLDKADRKALTRVVIDTDLASVYGKYKNSEVRAMLTNDDELNRVVSRAKHRLKEMDPKWYNWYTFQAEGLGRYLATGEAHIAQNFSALNIARGLLTAEYRKPSKELVQLIDELATLNALKYSSKADKAAVAELMRTDWRGVQNVVEMMRSFKTEAQKTVFKDDLTHMMKGYSKEVFDDRITMEIDLIDNKKEMEAKGFKLVKTLNKHSADTSEGKYGMYVSNMFSTNEFYRTATRITKLQSKGTGLKDIAYGTGDQYANIKHKTAKARLDKKRTEMVTDAIQGKLDVNSIEYGLAPILNGDGKVVDYRYIMDKESKEDFLGQSTDVAEIMGRTRGHLLDKYESAKHNEKLLSLLKQDAFDNYVPGSETGRNDVLYTLISPDSTDEKIRDLWEILPKSFKEEAFNNEYKGLPVRRDLMNNYFGYRHLSITDFPGIKQFTPAVVKSLIKVAETMWIEFIKIVKVDVLIKMPFVMVGNIISNAMYAVMTGTSPKDIVAMYLNSTRDVRAYLSKHRELVKLKLAKETGNKQKLDIGKIPMLERELKNNPIHELYELGVYQAIVEDVSSQELNSTNKLKQLYKDKTEKVPQLIKDGMNWLYLTEETQYYKVMTEVLQMSDLVARDIENRKLKLVQEKQSQGKMKLPRWFLEKHPGQETRVLKGKQLDEFNEASKEMRLDTVLNAFINYNKPSGSIEEYMNKVGLLMFTKYAKRVQRRIALTGTKYPLKSLMVLLGQSFILDVETIQDQSVFTRSWYNMGLSADDWVPGKPLWEYVQGIATPALFEGSTYKLL